MAAAISSMQKLYALHGPSRSGALISPLVQVSSTALSIQSSRLRFGASFRTRLSSLGSLGGGSKLRGCVGRSTSTGVSGSTTSGEKGLRELISKAAMAVPAVHEAWLYYEYGPAKEVLKLEEIAVPEVKPDQVLVKVKAAAINPVDYKRRTGYVTLNSPFPIVPGYDCAGVVVKVGDAASKFKVGDEVYGMTSESPVAHPKQWGTLAPYTACEDKFLALKPKNLSFEEAASLPLAILTATEGLQKAGCEAGKTVLVLGGAGGVGTHVIQVAKHVLKAAHVTATGSAHKTDFLKSLGADEVIDYHTVDYTEKPERYDIIYDTVGEGPTKGLKVMKDGGVLVSIATRDPTYRHVVAASSEVLEMLNPYLDNGAIKAIIDPKGKFKFSEVLQAFEYLETGRATGKVVIAPIA
ncbi:hypothetical protein M758_1G155800 [Ceratodon purpureus]|nr:hypothetical protein M758_1G155800 [Ceratodon purpureus]